MVKALGKATILNRVFNRDTDALKMEMVDGNGVKYKLVTSDLIASDLNANAYTFNPTVDAVEVLNKGTTDLTVTIEDMDFVIVPDEVRILALPAKIRLVAFSTGAVFRMNGLNRG
jgi:glutamine synthetase